uniref:cytochrome c biogenesis protein n=1 Tax=Tetradesmus bajacalifornicus TaxID=269609 RepID=UPI0030027CFD|nr:cytochrome c biogenesis protein [Tetradesmus bajacalifornicus]
MNILEIENFFRNSSFFFLFLSMISYWVIVAFDLKTLNFGRFLMIGANFCLLSVLILRWKESGHFPLSNLYESLMFLSWSLSTFHFILENIELNRENNFEVENFSFFDFSNKNKEQKNLNTNRIKQPFLGSLTSPAALFTNAFATFSLPSEMQHSSALVPALQSNWLMMHVTVMILSYSALICGSLLSIAFLIFTKNLDFDFIENGSSLKAPSAEKFVSVFPNSEKTEFFASASGLTEPMKVTPAFFNESSQPHSTTQFSSENDFSKTNSLKTKFAETLDNLSYRILGIGFPFLTIGILSGAVWANEAWGSYWSWDPKETWALATWFVFAIYLHTRLTKGWRGKKPAFIASFGFIVVWICFLGVNLLGEGLHSYGFFN